MMNIVNFDSGVCAMTDTGLVRPHNEDSNRVAHTVNGDLFVVCDGMGGHVGGATASRIGVDSVCQYVNTHECTIPQQFLTKALEYANAQIYNESRSNPELSGMGTTACVVLVREDKVWYAHVGDSRIYYFNAKQKALYRLTKDHSVVQALVDRGEITEAEAEHHPEKNKIRKSLGIKSNVEPEPCQMPLIPAEGDAVLICSDGLSGMMDEEDILDVLVGMTDVNMAGKTLIDLAKSGGGTDNITVQIVKFSGVGSRDAMFDAKNKGVSSQVKGIAVKNNSKRIWPWFVIAASVIMIVCAGVLLLSPSSTETNVDKSNVTVVTAKDEYAYKKEVPSGVKPIVFDKYEFYKRPNNPQGDLLVDMKNYTYSIGTFEELPIYENGNRKGTKYLPQKVTEYNRDGSPKQKN